MAKESPMPYKYSSLLAHPNSIRLLRLLPADRPDDPIKCQIFDYSLTTPSRTSHLYECLSYVWGDVKSRSMIGIDGAELAVTKNLYVALQRLRDPSLDRILWVDAVCINQEDLDERTQQVQIMAMIYANASRVIVWLGEEKEGSDEAMKLIREEASRMYRREKNFEMDEYVLDEKDDDVDPADEALPKEAVDKSDSEEATGSETRNQIMSFLRRPWFRRVLQEIAAARVMIVLCGTEEITGACFHRGLSGLLRLYDDPQLHSIVAPIIYLLGDASISRLKKHTTGKPFRLGICSLSKLIDMFRFREATDRRDKVYALLGIAPQSSEACEIKPDYSVGWATVFRDLVKSILGAEVEADWKEKSGKEFGELTGKGCTLGHIIGVDNSKSDRQIVSLEPTFHLSRRVKKESQRAELRWILHNSTTAVQQGDIVCWFEGSEGATIIRSQETCFTVVVVFAKLPRELAEKMFAQGGNPKHQSGHGRKIAKLAPIQYNRRFHLLWSFDADWTAPLTQDAQQSREKTARVLRLSSMAQIFEDVNDTNGIETVVKQGSGFLQHEETLPAKAAEHFRDLCQIIPNWSLYLELKQDLQKVVCGEGSTVGLPNDVELDIVEVRSRLVVGDGIGEELLAFLTNEISSLFSSSTEYFKHDQGLQLAFFFELWGSTMTPTSIIGFVEFVERLSLGQRNTLGHFLHPLYMEIIEILVRATSQQHQWGKSILQRLFEFAAGNVNRMYCLLRAFVVCSTTPPGWKQYVVEAILATHQSNFSAWASLGIEERYTTALDVLWDVYVVQARDFVALSSNGTFQMRAQILEKFVKDFRFWKACYEGHASAIWTGVVDCAQVDPEMLFICKDTHGRWCRVAAFEAAAMNGHIECCKVLLERGLGTRTTPASWIELCGRADMSKEAAEQIKELLSTYHPAQWGVSTTVQLGAANRSQTGKRSDTW